MILRIAIQSRLLGNQQHTFITYFKTGVELYATGLQSESYKHFGFMQA